ncbi:uncharacterized protein LOC126966511 isoform X2 [Leptidea sinapis]|nr:uncharacterized protein LOC126966511 isoform X2 [Leptidea sinapis]
MFQLKDTRARGLKRMFSVVVLMKDKMFLLNITPILSDHMQKVAKELQQLAEVVYDHEQSVYSQRALRLNTGNNDFGQSRSLIQLTGKEDIFQMLHSRFTWMLKIGSMTYSETLYTSRDLLNKLYPQNTKGSIFEDSCSANYDDCMSLRELEKMLSQPVFTIVLFCTLTGVDITIKSNAYDPNEIVRTLLKVLPQTQNKSPKISISSKEISSTKQCHQTLFLEEVDGIFQCKWDGSLPSKYPTLMNRIIIALSNDKFNDTVLHRHIKSLQLEWLGIARTIKSAIQSAGQHSDAVSKLKKILGIGQFDETLINFWIDCFL